MKRLVFVVYDGVLNSVFDGQVVAPLVKKLQRGDVDRVEIVSFEDGAIDEKFIDQVSSLHPDISLAILKKRRFLTALFLFPEILQLRSFLGAYPSYSLMARGALAGYIAQKAYHKSRCEKFVVQARGLLAEEYAYTHKNSPYYLKLLHMIRRWQYLLIEKKVYGNKSTKYLIEVVSNAIKDYVIKVCGALEKRCFLAHDDIPQSIAPARVVASREEIRKKLGISFNKKVYVFSGAAKSWQCPYLVMQFFKRIYEKDRDSFLFILTQDIDYFKKTLHLLPHDSYHICFVVHESIYQYLAVADYGLVFRDPGVVSWVARPVKAMEYEAVGLKIIHNNTVDWLIERHGLNQDFLV